MSEFLFVYEGKSGSMVSHSLLEVLEKVEKIEKVEKVEKTGGGMREKKVKTDRVFTFKGIQRGMDNVYFYKGDTSRIRIILFKVRDERAMEDIVVSYSFECDSKGSKIGEAEIDLADYDPDFYGDVDDERGLRWLVKNSGLELHFDRYLSTRPAP